MQRQPTGSIRADELLTLDEVQRRLDLGAGALRAARRRGLPVYRFGRRRFVLGADLIAYVKSNQGVTSCNGKQ